MKFKELLEVLHPCTDIDVELDYSLFGFETSIGELLNGNHKSFYNYHKDWDVVQSYPSHNPDGDNIMVIKINDKPKHTCYFEELQHNNSRVYCLTCGNSIPKL